jgi:hypothetical protein
MIHDMLYIADESPESATASKSDFPDFPGEEPPKAQLIAWVETWSESLNQIGYSAPLRGETPIDLVKLVDRPLVRYSTGLAFTVIVFAASRGPLAWPDGPAGPAARPPPRRSRPLAWPRVPFRGAGFTSGVCVWGRGHKCRGGG